MKRPVVLIIRDGWGSNPDLSQNEYNAIFLAKHPVDDRLMREYPHTLIKTCGLDVGLPAGVMGNSEVGHQNIGAGRIVDQEIVRIDKAIQDGSFFKSTVLLEAVEFVKNHKGRLHVMGLISDAGVHATIDHLMACVEFGKRNGLSEVFIHAITDGRDTPPTSGIGYLQQVKERCSKLGMGTIVSVSGRYYFMDRDQRWNRVQRAYDCMVQGAGLKFSNAQEALEAYYANPSIPTMKGDEFILPSNIVGKNKEPLALIQDGDAVIFANFRGDRPREITHAFTDSKFHGFDRGKRLDLYFATMTEYETDLETHPIFRKSEKIQNILGMYLCQLGFKQFRCAETEKYPHVTFFFNDYRDEPFENEDRVIVPSPQVPTYDLQPEMSADGVCKESVSHILSQKYDLMVINFANPDMVGHTGSLQAAVVAVETVDRCVGKILDAAQQVNASVIVTADHGNCEQMYDPIHQCPHTSHTLNEVALIVVDQKMKNRSLRHGGRLADIAPTVLDLMELEIPREMTGKSLIEKC